MIDVNLFVCLCATRFFLIKARILFFSQNRSKYVTMISKKPLKFEASMVKPKISPSKMKKKIYNIKPAL